MFASFRSVIGMSFLIAFLIFSITNSIIYPMMKTVPDCNWEDYAKSLVILPDIVSRYPSFLVIFPCSVIGFCTLIYLSEGILGKKKIMIIAKVLNTAAILMTILFLLWVIKGSSVMHEQMISCMGSK